MTTAFFGAIAAFLALCFGEWISPNARDNQIFIAICIGLSVSSIGYISGYSYRHITHYQDPAEVEKAQCKQDISDAKAAATSKAMKDAEMLYAGEIMGGRPLRLNQVGYWCKQVEVRK